jgi:hypothetical protein
VIGAFFLEEKFKIEPILSFESPEVAVIQLFIECVSIYI